MYSPPPVASVGIVVQVRDGSTRLPGKVAAPLGGKPLLLVLLTRLARVSRASGVIVSTSEESPATINIAEAAGVPTVQGPEEDLASRHLMAAEELEVDAFIRVTGDNPLIDPGGIDRLIECWQTEGPGVYHTKHQDGYPFGTGAELIPVELLRQHVTDGSGFFASVQDPFGEHEPRRVPAPPELQRPDYFLTVDYPEDLELMRRIFRAVPGSVDLPDVLAFLDEHPELPESNRHLHQPFPW